MFAKIKNIFKKKPILKPSVMKTPYHYHVVEPICETDTDDTDDSVSIVTAAIFAASESYSPSRSDSDSSSHSSYDSSSDSSSCSSYDSGSDSSSCSSD